MHWLSIAMVLVLGLTIQAANASLCCIDELVVFGDSLSDTGNVLARTGGVYPDGGLFGGNYDPGRFTDGLTTIPATKRPYTGVWHEQLARMLGIPVATPSEVFDGARGTNWAFGGATTGDGTQVIQSVTIDNMGKQVRNFIGSAGPNVPTNALYALWGGGNDLLNAAAAAGATAASIMAAEQQAVGNITTEIKLLADSGGTDFLWPDLPPLDKIPLAKNFAPALKAALGTASSDFRGDEASAIQGLEAFFSDIKIVDLDTYGLFNFVVGPPSEFFTNTTDPAQGNRNINPDTYLFWDKVHPTTAAHALLANFAMAALQDAGVVPCPEPPCWPIAFLAAVAILLLRSTPLRGYASVSPQQGLYRRRSRSHS
jgi:phospholipase/lecithinase/hemolysin